MKIDKNLIEERVGIANMYFCGPLEFTKPNQNDICLHKNQLNKVYKEMLHDSCVIDDCCRRFKKTFVWN